MVGFLLEGGLEASLVGYGAGDAVDGGRGDEVLPVVVVVAVDLSSRAGGMCWGSSRSKGLVEEKKLSSC